MTGHTGDRIADRVTVILCTCELLAAEAEGRLTPRQRELLDDALRAARDLGELLREGLPAVAD